MERAEQAFCAYYEKTDSPFATEEQIEKLFEVLDAITEAKNLITSVLNRETDIFDIRKMAYLLAPPNDLCGSWCSQTALEWYRKARKKLLDQRWSKVHAETFHQAWRANAANHISITDILALRKLAHSKWEFTISETTYECNL